MKNNDSILAVGSIAIDSVETSNGSRNNILGGSATYFSLSAGLVAPVKLVGVVGKDFPAAGWTLFKQRNINIDNVQSAEGKTFRWGGRYNEDFSHRETLFTELGVFESFSPIINDNDRKSPLIFLGNIHPNLQLAVAQMSLKSKFIISDTMNLWIDMCPDLLNMVLGLSQIFLINQEEAYQYTGIKDISRAASALRRAGPNVVVIKMGANGAYIAFNELEYNIPCFPVDRVVDPTGAGDTFAGGLVGHLATHIDKPDFLEAVLAASAMASFCVEGFGPEVLLDVSKDQLDSRVKIIKNRLN